MPFVSLRFVLILFTISILQKASALIDGDLRLSNGNTTKGWVEIYYDSRWNTISDQWVIYDISQVVCRQLGLPFTQAIEVNDVSTVPPLDNMGVLATTLFCDGDEARLTDCRQFEWSFPISYPHDKDIGVHCRGEYIQTGELRLVNGSNQLSGRLEIYQGNSWESICSVGFGVTEATVACRQLGLLNSSDVLVHPDAYFGQGSYGGDGPYIANCNGDEERIESCPTFYRSLDSDNYDELFCGHTQDVGICCPSETDGCAVVSEGSVVGAVVSCLVVVGIIVLLISCCCYCCKKKKAKKQYTAVVQNPAPQPVGGGQQVSMTPGGNTAPPVYYHGSTPGYPAGTVAPPSTQYPPTGQAMPPPAPVGGSTPYPPQPYPYPSGQVPPPAAAGSAPYPSQPYPYPVGQAPQQAGAYPPPNQYPPQPAAPYPPQPAAPYPPQEQPYPTKGDPGHPLPPHTGGGMPSAPPMDTSSGHEVAPSAPPPAYEHLIG
ncbi:scavenger receptor cysteine-rich type 1 protein M130 isoform X1 [Strongylocentrotus purpuratus]|uniref:SRCR domain-containing protein n=2 Tax=Strongylocentrotus purpuratus TaxID=7668 RepID=A0A7M7LIQ2_STRPU|nr:scavenger receptor cysteine-rich type 1 protein M130 isoform X1 [Strongylocentrotus purpuratus]|eukprot:XP_001200507.1 PREDICTED: scavenger receptor cysteine-rich type 1 protein M130 isoform X1 [Strongylocentrotus purpuratus]